MDDTGRTGPITNSPTLFFSKSSDAPQGTEVSGQLQVNGNLRHLSYCKCCKRKHRVHKYVNMTAIGMFVMI